MLMLTNMNNPPQEMCQQHLEGGYVFPLCCILKKLGKKFDFTNHTFSTSLVVLSEFQKEILWFSNVFFGIRKVQFHFTYTAKMADSVGLLFTLWVSNV